MIIGIQPDNGKVDEPLVDVPAIRIEHFSNNNLTTGIELTNATRTNINENFTITINEWWANPYPTKINCTVGYGISNGKGGYELISETKNIEIDGIKDNGQYSLRYSTLKRNIRFSPNGTYTIYAIYSTDNGKTWKKCAYYYMQPYVVKSTATTLSLVKTQLTADITTDETHYNGVEGTFKLSITNTGDDDFIGLINVYTSSTATCPDDAIAQPYMTIPAHSTVTREIGITPTTVGDMYVWIEDGESGEMLLNAKKFNVEQTTEPSYTIVSVTTNATPGVYETEKAYINTDKVKVPRVDDEKAEFTFGIRNNGGTGVLKYIFWVWNLENDSYKLVNTVYKKKIPGNGEITYLPISFTPEFAGGNTIYPLIEQIDSNGKNDAIPTSLPNYFIPIVGNENYGYKFNGSNPVVYIAGKPNAISGVTDSASSYVLGGTSEITILTEKAERLPIFRIDGSKVCDVIIEANTAKHVTVAPGLYIVRGKKIVVK